MLSFPGFDGSIRVRWCHIPDTFRVLNQFLNCAFPNFSHYVHIAHMIKEKSDRVSIFSKDIKSMVKYRANPTHIHPLIRVWVVAAAVSAGKSRHPSIWPLPLTSPRGDQDVSEPAKKYYLPNVSLICPAVYLWMDMSKTRTRQMSSRPQTTWTCSSLHGGGAALIGASPGRPSSSA